MERFHYYLCRQLKGGGMEIDMEISKKLAGQIVHAVYEVVGSDINFISASGIIIGSTNKSRIGTFHEAGCQAIQRGEPVIVEEAHTFSGAQAGINYPIFFEGIPIAVIGITGQPKELEKFGFLITKITEVFLKEQQLNQELLSETRSLHYLITSLIYDNIQNQQQFDILLHKYQMDPTEQYAVLSVQMLDTSLEQSLRFYFSGIGCQLSLYLYPNEWVVLFDQGTYALFSSQEFTLTYKGRLHAGISTFAPLYQASQSYQDACTARNRAFQMNTALCTMSDISIEFALESIPANMKTLYANQILNPLTDKELHILKTYLLYGLSLKDTAEVLFIHKNTLQYQLDKITDKTGLNPRRFQDAFLLQFAFLCRESEPLGQAGKTPRNTNT